MTKGYIVQALCGRQRFRREPAETQLYGIPAGRGCSAPFPTAAPAAEAGLQAGDVITTGQRHGAITGSSDLVKSGKRSRHPQATRWRMTVYRQGSTMELTVTVGEQVQSALANEQTQQATSDSQSGGWNGYPFGGRR